MHSLKLLLAGLLLTVSLATPLPSGQSQPATSRPATAVGGNKHFFDSVNPVPMVQNMWTDIKYKMADFWSPKCGEERCTRGMMSCGTGQLPGRTFDAAMYKEACMKQCANGVRNLDLMCMNYVYTTDPKGARAYFKQDWGSYPTENVADRQNPATELTTEAGFIRPSSKGKTTIRRLEQTF